jgi:hypothetical protein
MFVRSSGDNVPVQSEVLVIMFHVWQKFWWYCSLTNMEHYHQNFCQTWNITNRTSVRPGTLSQELLSELEHYHQNFCQTWDIITRTSDWPGTLSTELLTDLEHYQQNFWQTWNIINRTSVRHGTLSPELLTELEHYHQNLSDMEQYHQKFWQTCHIITQTSNWTGTLSVRSSGDNVPGQSKVLVIMSHVCQKFWWYVPGQSEVLVICSRSVRRTAVRTGTLSTELLTDMQHYQQNFWHTCNIITRTTDLEHYQKNVLLI